MSNHTNGTLTNKPVIRLCHITKWDDYDGYGFNLHAEKNKPGQFIGKVDDCSPAQSAGLKEGDRIIEVNGDNVMSEDHKQVVSKIKQVTHETKLLVVDKESYDYFQSNNVDITSSLPEVVTLKTSARASSGQQEMNGNGTTQSASPRSERSVSSSSSSTTTTNTTEDQQQQQQQQQVKGNKLNLNMTVDEIRSKLASRKKYDPKKELIDIKKKHEIIDKL